MSKQIMEFRVYPDKLKQAVEVSQITSITQSFTPDKKKKLTVIYVGVGLSEYIQVFEKYEDVLADWHEAKDEEEKLDVLATFNKLDGENDENVDTEKSSEEREEREHQEGNPRT